MDILNIDGDLELSSTITSIEYHDYEAYAGTRYGNTDEIRIEVKNQEIYTLPSASLLYVEGKLLNAAANTALTHTKLVKNFLAHLFTEIRFRINDFDVDKTRHVGVGSTLKGIVSFTPEKLTALTNGGWSSEDTTSVINATDGSFNIVLPLNTLMGFFEDHTKILINCKQELVLLRDQNDSNAVLATALEGGAFESSKIEITKMKWKVPHVEVDDEVKLKLQSHLRLNKPVMLGFRSWFVGEKPMPTTTSRDEWTLQSMTSLERPRHIILAFQTNKRNIVGADANSFDHCNIRNIKAYINGKCFPYTDYNLNFGSKQCAMLYNSYANFQRSYYNTEPRPLLSYVDFLKSPVFVIDCSKQVENIKTVSVDVRIEIEATQSFPANTSAYCFISHDRIIEYTPLTNVVRRHM
jgi:hypothetical protein